MELEQSTFVDLIKGSVWSSVWVPEFDMKHLKKTEECIGRNIVSITMKMKTTVWIFEVIKIIKLYLRNLDRFTTVRIFLFTWKSK